MSFAFSPRFSNRLWAIMNLSQLALIVTSFFLVSGLLPGEEPANSPITFCNPVSLPTYLIG